MIIIELVTIKIWYFMTRRSGWCTWVEVRFAWSNETVTDDMNNSLGINAYRNKI